MLYLVGLGLNKEGISKQGFEIVKHSKRVYLENYTVDFPYPLDDLEVVFGKKVESVNREFIEGLTYIDEAKKKDVVILVYGSPLTATTHITIVDECKKSRVKCKVIYGASIFDSVAKTGLQLYKFGKVASMPTWQKEKNFTPDSFVEIVKQNNSIEAHSLILVDIGLNFDKAAEQLKKSFENHKLKLEKFAVCQMMGTGKEKIYYGDLKEFDKVFIRSPYCFVIPNKMHFLEKEIIETFQIQDRD
jgi:diphthine synthase